MNQAGSATLFSTRVASAAAPSTDHSPARDLRRSEAPIRSWAAMLVRVITSGLLHTNLQRPRHHAGIARSEVETLALIQRAFGKRHG